MYCIKCGFKNEDEAIFCANCGSVMTKKPSDADNQKIQSEENTDSAEKNDIEEVQQTVAEVQAERPEEVQEQNREEIQPVEQVQSTEEKPSKVSLAKPEAVQSDNMNNVNNLNNVSDIPADLYHSPYTNENTGNNNTYRVRKFSAPRFVFSLIILLATVCSIVTIAFDYVGINMEISLFGEEECQSEYITGFEIIKEKVEVDEAGLLDELDDYDNIDEFTDTLNTFRYFLIAFAVAMLVFCIIDFMLLCLVRKKVAYILTMIFALIKAALGGISLYLWSAEVLYHYEKIFKALLSEYIGFSDFKVTLECMPAIGLILALAMQAVIIVSAVVLLCTKPKYEEVAQQTIRS